MPQMSPMPWMILMIITLIMLMVICTNIYFNKNIMFLKSKIKKSSLNLKW